jgi:hypothetical protein
MIWQVGLVVIVSCGVMKWGILYMLQGLCFKQPAVPQNGFGFKALFIATSLFLISSGSASNVSTNILKFSVFILSIIFWAWENPTVWGNYRGANAYVYNEAWGKGAEEKLIHNDIIIHLMNAYDNWINFLHSSLVK